MADNQRIFEDDYTGGICIVLQGKNAISVQRMVSQDGEEETYQTIMSQLQPLLDR